MKVIDRIERAIGKYIPEQLTKLLIVGQVLSYVLVYTQPFYRELFLLSGSRLLSGDVWRLVTFPFGPTSENMLFVLFAWYFFYLLGTMLENRWGVVRYALYLLTAYCALILFSLLFPLVTFSNASLYTSVFLAFAYLFPNFQVLLFFIIPVKVKWLGYLAWFGLFVTFLTGGIAVKALTLASVVNYFVFFASDIRYTSKALMRGATKPLPGKIGKEKPLHVCAVCGKNEIDNPNMDIRYCSTCVPQTCYCGEHSQKHQHKRMVN